MIKILNNIVKGLLFALVIILTGGIFLLNAKVSPNTSMILVSSSLVNSIKTDKEAEKLELKEEEKNKEETIEIEEKKEEIKEEKKEEIKKVEENPVVSKTQEVQKEVVEQKEEVKVETPVEQPKPAPSVPTPSGSYSPNTNAVSGESNQTFSGLVTAYGPDCYGCYGSKTAMGDYVGEGNIYYNHPTYGNIRIVAGDRSILNKVVRITGLNISSEPVIAIVRDTGGDIGFNKPKGIVLDLLFTSEKSKEVLNFGMQKATVEVLN